MKLHEIYIYISVFWDYCMYTSRGTMHFFIRSLVPDKWLENIFWYFTLNVNNKSAKLMLIILFSFIV